MPRLGYSSMTAVLAIWFALSDAALHSYAQAPATAAQNMVTEFKGKLKGFDRGIVTVIREDESEVSVQLPDNITAFQFVATAKPAFLKRGALVRFSGTFNQAGASLSPITKVELFQPVSGKVSGRARQNFMPGVHPETRIPRNERPPATAKCQVVGGIMGIDGSGVMTVQAGKRPIRVQLSPDVKFEIRYNNLSLANEGDAVSVAGFYQPPDETKVKAERITVTTDRVYGEATEKPKKRGRGKPSENAGDPLDEAAKKREGPAAEK